MASTQSSVSFQELEERIRVLEVERKKRQPENDYVYVPEEESVEAMKLFSADPCVSISTTEQWEKELMQDPKVLRILPV